MSDAWRPELLRAIWPQSGVLLNSTQIAGATELVGDDARLACVRGKLRRGESISMAAVGGSVTAGSNYRVLTSDGSFLYHQKLLLALQRLYPASHSLLNGGVPATGPTYMEHCVHDHLPRGSAVDLVLLEYAVNTDRQPAAFERLLRILLRDPRAPAVIVLNVHRWRSIRPRDGRTDKCWHAGKWRDTDMRTNRTQWAAQSWGVADARWPDLLNADEDAIAALCRHYRVPLVSMRGATLGAVRSGDLALPAFMIDCKHPRGEGHSILAQGILHRLLSPPSAFAAGLAQLGGGAPGSPGAQPGCGTAVKHAASLPSLPDSLQRLKLAPNL